jgi:glycosyltransferase involved in cell wall biosynthesis
MDHVVTVILFVHAPYARFLGQSLASILGQSYSSLEVIVLSDGSTEVRQAVEPFKDDRRWVLCSQGDQPFLLAANEKMKACRGSYVATWNSDDIYRSDHVKALVDAMESDPDCGAAFDNLEYFSDTDPGYNLGVHLIVPGDRAKKLALIRLSVQQIFEENFMTGPSSLIRKSVFQRVGGYDQNTFLNCDLHWFYRIAAYFPIRFVDYVGVKKRIHSLNNTARNPHYEYGVKELEHIRDHYPDVYCRIGKKVFNKKLGRKYFRLGLYYEELGDLDKAREAFKKAMLLRKLSFRYGWEYCRASVGRAFTS